MGMAAALSWSRPRLCGSGVLDLLDVNGRIQDAVGKVVPNGGTVIKPVHSIGPHGFRADRAR